MSKKQFIALAQAIKQAAQQGEPFGERQIERLADFCQQQNHNFKRERWLDFIKGLCGSNGGKV